MKISHIALIAAFLPMAAVAEVKGEAPIGDEAIRMWIMENPQVIIDSLTKYEQDQKEKQDNELVERVAAVRADLSVDAPVLGNPDGDVEMIMFSDYRCPHCRNAHAALEKLIEADPNVRVVIRELPILGEASVLAARYALAVNQVAGQDAYEAVNKRIFGAEAVNLDWISADIDAQGFDKDLVVKLLDDEALLNKIHKNYELAQQIGISGTPFFVVNETPAPGGLTADTMIRAVKEERDKLQTAKQ